MKNSGFTLIEVIVASAIFALLMVGVYTVMHIGIGFGRSERDRDLQNMEAAHAAIKPQLESAFISPDSGDYRFQGSQSSVSFFIMPANAARPAKIEYFMGDGLTCSGFCRTINDDPLNPDAADPEPQPVADRLNTVTFSYYDGGAWVSSWNNSGALPQRVRITAASNGMTQEQEIFLPLAKFGMAGQTSNE